jgi:transposase-like protein
VKAGHNHGRQRYKCRGCGRQVTQTEDRNGKKRALALYLYVTGLSMNAIARGECFKKDYNKIERYLLDSH